MRWMSMTIATKSDSIDDYIIDVRSSLIEMRSLLSHLLIVEYACDEIDW